MFNASNTVRLFFVNIVIVMMLGIWLTGFEQVHWFMYAVPAFLSFAAVTGFCPGLIISKTILGVFGIKE